MQGTEGLESVKTRVECSCEMAASLGDRQFGAMSQLRDTHQPVRA
jgi:hypothetical protein